MKYRRKPVEVEALQWKGSWTKEFDEFTKNNMNQKFFHQQYGALYVETLKGTTVANIDDWIIKDEKGYRICVDSIFKEVYEPCKQAVEVTDDDTKKYAVVVVGPNNEIPFSSYVQVKKNGGVPKEKLAEILPYVGKELK